MKPLSEGWADIKKNILGRQVFLFLDYDGTLTPIVEVPQLAALDIKTRQLLANLAKLPNCTVVIISGRAIDDLKVLVGVEKVIYVGNHGYEIEGECISFEGMIPPQFKSLLGVLKNRLGAILSQFSGSFIEDKGATVSIHFRRVDRSRVELLQHEIRRILGPYLESKQVCTVSGKQVVELRPPIDWDKGKAVSYILNSQQERLAYPICIGDDVTDEDVFRAVADFGATIHVGSRGGSCARYYVPQTNQVYQFLVMVYELKKVERRYKA